jgi:hypothetical protein
MKRASLSKFDEKRGLKLRWKGHEEEGEETYQF